MKLLFVVPELPHSGGGGAKRMLEQLKHLVKAGATVDVLAYRGSATVDDKEVSGLAGKLYKYEVRESFLRKLWNLVSLRAYSYYPGFMRLANGLVESGNYDLIHVHKFQMAEYFSGITSVPVVVDLWACGLGGAWRDFLYERNLARKMVKLLRLLRFYLADRHLYPAFENYFVVSEDARDYVLGKYPGKNVAVVPHGVDIRPAPSVLGKDLVFVGDMSFFQNVDTVRFFCKEIFPLVKAEYPDITFYVVGKAPTRDTSALAEDPSVIVTGFVEDIGPYLRKGAVFVAPIRTGSGLRTKLLEAFSYGLPVVTSERACEGIPVHDGHEVMLADEPAEYARKVIWLLRNRKEAAEMGENARRLAASNYSWERIAADMLARYNEILHNNNLQR